MLSRLSDDIAECYRHAEECAQLAQSAVDPGLREDFVGMERRWLCLANGYEFAGRIGATYRN